MRTAAMTDVGRVRLNNEDSYYANDEIGLFVVADGMGGHASGEIASKMTVDIIRDYFKGSGKNQPVQIGPYMRDYSDVTNRLASAIRLANMAVYEASLSSPELQGMGTTVAAIQIAGNRLSIAHIGDSRVYLIRAENIEQLTDDHSVVYEQIKRNLISKEDASKSEIRNILTRALGISDDAEVDLAEMTLSPGDILLLCSDGLNGMVDDTDILSIILASDDPPAACKKLIAAANANGGKDNITVVLIYTENKPGFFSFLSLFFKWFWR
ncbi:MAG: Stp1/IreP family PP2C-type Ser/Thr phosphatase [Syntrophales bacterium]|nr:Stp1/IreP family PP2C-type Ser/Thr phosphatase [Syntrophales bacterium]